MSDHALPAPPLSETEAREFDALGLTPGCWAALAPAPLLLCGGLRRPFPAEFDHLRALAELLPGEPGRAREPEEFWTRCAPPLPPDGPLALLGWHLAHRV